jgi:ABC-type molybdate transport system substrate-binding protein
MIAGLPRPAAPAAEIKVMHGGAFTQVITGIVPDFEKQTGHSVLERETVGALTKRIEGGSVDMAILTLVRLRICDQEGHIAAGSR